MNNSSMLLEEDYTPDEVDDPIIPSKLWGDLAPNEVVDPGKFFTELLQESGSDKYYRHHFERYYSDWFEPFRRKQNITILEIGAKGGKSISLWDNYFEHAELILGLAYEYGTEHLTEIIPGMRQNVRVHFGDQSIRETMQVLADAGPFDIIIDDGSHVPQHVLFSLYSLWKSSLREGGIYVIEDLETSYWPDGSEIYGYTINQTGIGAGPEFSVVTKLEQIEQVLVRHQLGAKELSGIMPGDEDLCSVEWGMNLVALRKCSSSTGSNNGASSSPFLKPRFQKKRYNKKRMNAWLREARRTNPKGFLGEVAE